VISKRRTAVGVVLVLAVSGAAFGQAKSDAPADIDGTRSTVGKWVATQELIFKERKSWQQEQEILSSRIELIRKEIADLEQRLAETRKVLGESAARRSEADATKRELVGAAETIGERLARYEQKTRSLYKVLPESTREKVEPLHRRIPDDPATTKVSLAERFQNVLGILNEVNRINGEITLATEVRPLSDGKPSEVKTIYVGLGQAYFISARDEAGIGRPTAEGWTWEPRNELARDVNIAIQMLQNTAKPSFVSLPVSIQ
jgi:hypothetical protein